MRNQDVCPLTGLVGLDNEVYIAVAYRSNPLNMKPFEEIWEICEEIYIQRRVRYVHQKQQDEHPGFGDKLSILLFGSASKATEPQQPSEEDVSKSVAFLLGADRIRKRRDGSYVRSFGDLPEDLEHLAI